MSIKTIPEQLREIIVPSNNPDINQKVDRILKSQIIDIQRIEVEGTKGDHEFNRRLVVVSALDRMISHSVTPEHIIESKSEIMEVVAGALFKGIAFEEDKYETSPQLKLSPIYEAILGVAFVENKNAELFAGLVDEEKVNMLKHLHQSLESNIETNLGKYPIKTKVKDFETSEELNSNRFYYGLSLLTSDNNRLSERLQNINLNTTDAHRLLFNQDYTSDLMVLYKLNSSEYSGFINKSSESLMKENQTVLKGLMHFIR
jgi:hypothetical protein